MKTTLVRAGAVAFIGLALGTVASAAAAPTTFEPKCGISASVTLEGQQLSYEVRKGDSTSAGALTLETEKTVRVTVADYNFDGYQDFSASHTDDGMGTYTLFHIFVYEPKTNNFVALRPKCGDEFINVVVNPKKRTLTNSYFADNRMKSCSAKY